MASGSGVMCSGSGSSSASDFDSWVKNHGGSDQFLNILHSKGFTSTLSLSELIYW